MKKYSTFIFVFILGTLVAYGQMFPEKGVPSLQNLNPTQYNNKGKIWDIRSDHNGVVFMAADKGLLEYDGKNWNSYKGSTGFTRSLLVVNDSLIYTGSDLDFGVWKKNKYQTFEYTSLYPFQKETRNIYEEFWDVHQLKDNIIFVSFQNIYVYKNQQLTKIDAPSRFTGSFAVDDSLYFADEKYGLFVLTGFSLKQVFRYPDERNLDISGIYHQHDGTVIVTKNRGLYFYSSGKLSTINNDLSKKLSTANVFCFEQINKTHLAFGTILKGLYITNLEGKIIHHINKNKGLLNSTILSLHYSSAGKLWMGMDYGVSVLDLMNNLTYFYDYAGTFGTGYTALIKDHIFYLGTNQGLYFSNWEDLNNDDELNRFQLVPGTEGQVWTLENINNTILIGHDLGLFSMKDQSIEKLNSQHGVWTILSYGDYLLTGNYNGISIFKKSENNWTFQKNMELIFGSCNQLIIEKENILWINIPNYGIIRAVLDKNFYPAERLIFTENHFDGDNPYISLKNNEIHVITDKFQYTFDPVHNKFTEKTEHINQPKVKGLLSGIYQHGFLNSDYSFHSIYNGFALKYLKNNEAINSADYSLILRKIAAFSNEEKSLFYPDATIPYRLNNLQIEYIVPNQEDVLYQYKLNDSEDWGSWVPDNSFEFLNLSEGSYNLMVRALINGKITETTKLSFRIAAPYYRSWYAYVLYALMMGLGIYFLRSFQKLTLKKQRKMMLIKEQNSLRQQAEKYNREIMLLEQERLLNENNQIKEQLKSKTIELANKAKDSEDKNRLLLTLKEKCDSAQNNPCLSKTKWAEFQRLLESYLKIEDKTFEIQMDELHQELFKKLKDSFPGLTNNDLRLCAYLKIGLNSKEIADILNIQPSSSYITRSRLRKKLNLKPDEDLYDFLNAI